MRSLNGACVCCVGTRALLTASQVGKASSFLRLLSLETSQLAMHCSEIVSAAVTLHNRAAAAGRRLTACAVLPYLE